MDSAKGNMGRRNSFYLFLLATATVLLAVSVMVGCGSPAGTPTKQSGQSTAQGGKDTATASIAAELTGSITVAGSTSVQPVSELLAEAFMTKHSGVTINVQGGGSSAGIQAVEAGVAEIGASSRDLRDTEKHLNQIIIGQDGIAVIMHPANEIDDLSLEQIKDIFAGKITNWSEIGGTNAEITGVTREEGSGTRGAFEEIVMDGEEISARLIVQNSTGACRTTVAGDKNSISYISLAAMNEDVKAIKVNGVEVSTENIISGKYMLARPFIYVTKGEPKGIAKDFLDFVVSSEAQRIIKEAGLISIY